MNKLFIPPLGTVLILAAPWTFTVYREHRNKSLVALSGLNDQRTPKGTYDPDWWRVIPLGRFTFRKGTALTVDRIYIRAGGEEYNSVTFRARDFTTKVLTGLKGKKENVVRFWAKLDEVNGMKCV